MATAMELDAHCNLTHHPFNINFRINNYTNASVFQDGITKSENQSICSGNILLQLRVTSIPITNNGSYQRTNSNIQLYGLVNKGEAFAVGTMISTTSPGNYIQPMDSNRLKKLSSEKDSNFELITEYQTPDYHGSPSQQLLVTVTGTILIPSFNKDEIKTMEKLRKTSLPQELSALLQISKYSDIDISVDGNNFSVHKIILWSRSKGFAELLEEMESKNNNSPINILTISGFRADVVQEALNYMYTGQVPNINEYACDLLEFSDKYKIVGLKILCESVVKTSIAVDNACELAALAVRVNSKQLKSFCIDFIKKNIKSIVGTEQWKEFRKNNSDLIADILEAMAIDI